MSIVAHWGPGDHHGLVWHEGAALLDASVGLSDADALWRRLSTTATDLVGFCTLLSEVTGLGLLQLPGFAVATGTGDSAHVAARGGFAVAGGGAGHLSGHGVTTWAEAHLVVPSDIMLSQEGGATPHDLPYVLVSGTVPAHALALRWEVSGAVGEPAPLPEDQRSEEVSASVEKPSQLWGDLTLLGKGPPVGANAIPTPGGPDTDPDPADGAVPDGDLTRFDAIPIPTAGEESAEHLVTGGRAESQAPRLLPPPITGPRTTETSVADDSATVIRRPRTSASVPAGPPSSTRVRARVCPSGHANPPHLRLCRVCGAGLPATTQEVARPSLGRLVTSEGTTVDLVAPVVIGREPSALRFQGTTAPRLLKVSHAHVSANHVEIRLEEWAVLAADLHSTNGSYVRRLGHPALRLTEDPVALGPGDVLDLGHGVEITYQEPR